MFYLVCEYCVYCRNLDTNTYFKKKKNALEYVKRVLTYEHNSIKNIYKEDKSHYYLGDGYHIEMSEYRFRDEDESEENSDDNNEEDSD